MTGLDLRHDFIECGLKKNYTHTNICLFCFFLTAPHGMGDRSFLARDRTHFSCIVNTES